jgi:hypothetical protein
MTTFIYALVDPFTGQRRYVGKSNNPKQRVSAHIGDRRKNNHKNAWIKTLIARGARPQLEILEECLQDGWQERETFWITKLRAEGCNLTNLLPGGECGPLRKGPMPTEQREKIAAAHRGKKMDPEVVARVAEKLRGRKIAPEAIAKTAAALRGRPKTPEHVEKLRQVLTGKKRTEEQCRRMSEASKGFSHTPETRAKISSTTKGVPKSAETREKMRQAQLNRPMTQARLDGYKKIWETRRKK